MKYKIFSSFFFFSTLIFSQNIGINENGSQADPSAILDVESEDKGMLIPRVELISVNDPINNPETSLLVFNTSNAGTYSTPGFYYFDGTDWVPLVGGATSNEQTIIEERTTNFSASVSRGIIITPILTRTFTPINNQVMITVSVAGRTTGSFSPSDKKWGFELRVDGTREALIYDDFTTDGTRDLITTFQIPVDVNVGNSTDVVLNLVSFGTLSGTANFDIEPNTFASTSFANLKIEDKDFN